jgi:hypothetical protein
VTDEADTTRPDPDPDQAAVRRLLADARRTEPMPADVAARMDDVLADLQRETPVGAGAPEPSVAPRTAPTPAPPHPVVVSFAAQRRRRAAGMLLGAAAVVVGAVVVVPHLPAPGDSSSSPSSAADNNGSDLAGGSVNSPGPEADAGKVAGGRVQVRDGRVVVRPDHFTSDAAAAQRLLKRTRATAPQAYRMLDRPTASCVVPHDHGTLVSATYERAPAVLVFHRPESSTQVVDLFVCGSDTPVRSVTLPLP